MLHLALHFLVPAVITGIFYRKRWKTVYSLMMASMLVDLDHLLANPIYDPQRCSIGFHPLHEPWFIIVYALLCVSAKSRVIGIGLMIHMVLDSIDCQVTGGTWYQ